MPAHSACWPDEVRLDPAARGGAELVAEVDRHVGGLVAVALDR